MSSPQDKSKLLCIIYYFKCLIYVKHLNSNVNISQNFFLKNDLLEKAVQLYAIELLFAFICQWKMPGWFMVSYSYAKNSKK